MPLKPINLDHFYKSGTNVHEAIVVASRRARQVNEEVKIEFNQRIETLVPKSDVETEGEMDVNPDQLRISMEFEKRPKPTDVSLQELVAGDIEWRYKEVPEPVAPPEEETEEPEEE
jgi:DNA-directed RNA polymerase subunit K/omega